jgi:competence protein ComEC
LMLGLSIGRLDAACLAKNGLLGPVALLASALGCAFAATVSARRAPRLWSVALSLAMFLAGAASYGLHHRALPDRDGLPPREARFSLRIDRVAPPKYYRAATTGLAKIVGAEPHLRELLGQTIAFSLNPRKSDPPVIRSEVVTAMGLLAAVPRNSPAGSFARSLQDQGLNYTFARGRVLAEERPPGVYRLFCERLAGRMYALLGGGLARHPELASVYRAMMLGRKGDLTPEQRRLFLESGTMHLFAINGLHIGVVAVALHALLALLRCPRVASGAIVLAVLWLDVDTTGDSASAVRAFLMIAVLECAAGFRLPGNPPAALAASVLIVLLVRPMDFFGASFEMSYGVVSGIILLGLPLAERFRAPRASDADHSLTLAAKFSSRGCERERVVSGAQAWLRHHLLGAASVGFAAALVGAPAGIQFFGLIAPSGLLANLAIAPSAAFAIVAGFSSLVLGLCGAGFGSRLCNCAAGVALRAIEAVMLPLTRLPGAWFSAHFRAEWIGPATLAAVVAACLAGYASGWRRDRGGFWPPAAVVAIALVLGVHYGP